MPPTLQILVRNRDFRRLFSADLIGLGADWFVQIPLLSLLLQLTGSGVWGALVLAADVGVIALLQPYAGVIADRFDRRRILITAELAMAVATLALLLVRTAAAAGAAVAAIAVIAVAKAFFVPAASAALPNVVDAEDLPGEITSQVQGLRFVISGLPEGMVLTEVTVVDDGVRLAAEGRDLRISAAG